MRRSPGTGRHRRRVLFYSDSRGVGGAEEVLVHVSTYVDRDRWIPRVVLPRDPTLAPLVERLVSAGLPVDELDLSPNLSWPRRLLTFASYLRSVRPDLLYVNRPWLDWSSTGVIAAWLARVPKLILHEHFPVPLTWGERDGPDAPARRPLLGLGLRSWRVRTRRRLPALLARWIILPSNAAREVSLTEYHYPRARTRTVHNGIDVEGITAQLVDAAVARREVDLPADAPVLLFMGRLSGQKGLRFLLEAMPRLVSSFPEAILVLAGDGPLRGNLEALSRGLGLTAHVRFLGWRNDVVRLLCAADVFVLPSLSESFPLVILEAMAAAKPVVATRVGGVAEVVEHNRTGILVTPRDVEGLAAALGNLLRAPERRHEMGQAGQRLVRGEFSLVKALAEIYRIWDA